MYLFIHYLKCITIILQDNRIFSVYIHIHKIMPQIMSLIMPIMAVRTENIREVNNMKTFYNKFWHFFVTRKHILISLC